MTLSSKGTMRIRSLLIITTLLLVQIQQITAFPTTFKPEGSEPFSFVNSRQPSIVSGTRNKPGALKAFSVGTNDINTNSKVSLNKRVTPVGMPLTCSNDFDCLQTTQPARWPKDHDTVQSGNYACVFSSNSTGGNSTGTCQFVVTAGEQCNAASDCAAFAFYSQRNMPTPSDLCSPQHCTIESSCGSPWQDSDAPQNHAFTGSSMSCCGGQPTGDICSLVGSNVDTCEYQSVCNFDSEDYNGTGTCQAVDEREHVWIGVVITLISSTILNIGLNGQKYALRKHDERRVQKEIEMEEEHERWRQELGWTEDQVQQEADRLYELKENRRGALYRRLKPYMFWRNIFVSKLWLLGLIVFIIGNLGGFIALRFAPQSLTAPLGSIALISNVIIAPLINKEVLGKWDLAGIFFIVAGSVIVVVFSGIVSPDYKLCVLINLFQKTSTIIYLSFIGTCIILTFFFIQFVEKNVENEDDVAIGVSAERVLQKEGRLNRIHSNASNLSLAAKDHQELSLHGVIANSSTIALKDVDGGEGTTAQPKILEEPLEVPARSFAQQPGVALNPSSSHQTTTSDALGKAIGTSSAVGTDHPQEHRRPSFGSSRSSSSSISSLEANTSPGRSGAVDGRSEPKLKFGEPLKSPGASATTAKPAGFTPVGSTVKPDEVEPTRPEISRSQSMATIQSSHRSIRKRRNRTPDLSNTNDGAPFSFWERVKQIEFIPSLPEDKLIRRNSPLLRFCLPLAYAALGGMMASYTVLFAKSLINLLVTSIFNGQNQFTSGLAWVILVVTVITAVSQVYWINMGLKKYDALLQVPVFFTIWVLLDIVGGGIYYGEFSGFTVEKYVLFCIGVLTVFFGVALLAKRLAVLAKEDVGESQIESVHSRRGSVMKEASTGGSRRGSVMREVPRRQSVVDKNEVAVDSRRGSAVQEQGAEGGPSTSVVIVED